MVRITNGNLTLTVPNSAYELTYRSCGFRLLADEEDVVAPNDSLPTQNEKDAGREDFVEENENTEEDSEYEEEEVNLSEIPLSEMDFYQLQDYAEQLGLDYEGIRSKKELRALIRNNT